MATLDEPEAIALLKEIRDAIFELRDLYDSHTDNGFPLKSTVPTTESMAALICTASLLLRDTALSEADLQHRSSAAMVLSSRLLQMLARYQSETRSSHLENLLPKGS